MALPVLDRIFRQHPGKVEIQPGGNPFSRPLITLLTDFGLARQF